MAKEYPLATQLWNVTHFIIELESNLFRNWTVSEFIFIYKRGLSGEYLNFSDYVFIKDKFPNYTVEQMLEYEQKIISKK